MCVHVLASDPLHKLARVGVGVLAGVDVSAGSQRRRGAARDVLDHLERNVDIRDRILERLQRSEVLHRLRAVGRQRARGQGEVRTPCGPSVLPARRTLRRRGGPRGRTPARRLRLTVSLALRGARTDAHLDEGLQELLERLL